MISDSWPSCQRVEEVVYDAEHFFDGFTPDPEYALATLRAADAAGADCLVLCDTNGGTLPGVAETRRGTREPVAVAARHPRPQRRRVRGGELAGRGPEGVEPGPGYDQWLRRAVRQRDLVSLIPDLAAQAGPRRSRRAPCASFATSRASPLPSWRSGRPVPGQPLRRDSAPSPTRAASMSPRSASSAESYQHVDPTAVGNELRVAGERAGGAGEIPGSARGTRSRGGHGDGRSAASGSRTSRTRDSSSRPRRRSFELLVRRAARRHRPPFDLEDSGSSSRSVGAEESPPQATVDIRVGTESDAHRR